MLWDSERGYCDFHRLECKHPAMECNLQTGIKHTWVLYSRTKEFTTLQARF